MDWDWVKRIAPTVAIIGTVVGMFFLFDGWQKERFLWLAEDIGKLDRKIDKVEARLTDDIRKVEARLTDDIRKLDRKIDKVEARLTDDIRKLEARLAGDIEKASQRLDRSEAAPKASSSPASEVLIQLLAGKRTAVPVAYVTPGAAELPSFDVRQMLMATYSDNKLTVYPDAEDAQLIALLLKEGWRQIDQADVSGGFVLPRLR